MRIGAEPAEMNTTSIGPPTAAAASPPSRAQSSAVEMSATTGCPATGLGDGLVELVLAPGRERDVRAIGHRLDGHRAADAGRRADDQDAPTRKRRHHFPLR